MLVLSLALQGTGVQVRSNPKISRPVVATAISHPKSIVFSSPRTWGKIVEPSRDRGRLTQERPVQQHYAESGFQSQIPYLHQV